MSDIRLIGLETIKFAAVTTSGEMRTTLVTISAIVPDSAHLIIEPPGTTDLFIEDTDIPDIQLLGTSKKTLEFATRDLGTSLLVSALGGSATATAWSAAVTAIVIKEWCIQAISKVYNKFQIMLEIPRSSVHVGGDLRFCKTESGQITFSCDVLLPNTSAVIAPLKITKIAG